MRVYFQGLTFGGRALEDAPRGQETDIEFSGGGRGRLVSMFNACLE
jgi:hypothetical protein